MRQLALPCLWAEQVVADAEPITTSIRRLIRSATRFPNFFASGGEFWCYRSTWAKKTGWSLRHLGRVIRAAIDRGLVSSCRIGRYCRFKINIENARRFGVLSGRKMSPNMSLLARSSPIHKLSDKEQQARTVEPNRESKAMLLSAAPKMKSALAGELAARHTAKEIAFIVERRRSLGGTIKNAVGFIVRGLAGRWWHEAGKSPEATREAECRKAAAAAIVQAHQHELGEAERHRYMQTIEVRLEKAMVRKFGEKKCAEALEKWDDQQAKKLNLIQTLALMGEIRAEEEATAVQPSVAAIEAANAINAIRTKRAASA